MEEPGRSSTASPRSLRKSKVGVGICRCQAERGEVLSQAEEEPVGVEIAPHPTPPPPKDHLQSWFELVV